MKYSQKDLKKIVAATGMSLSKDNLVFTLTGGELCNGQQAEPFLAKMNGWDIPSFIQEVMKRKAVRKINGQWRWVGVQDIKISLINLHLEAHSVLAAQLVLHGYRFCYDYDLKSIIIKSPHTAHMDKFLNKILSFYNLKRESCPKNS